MNEHFAAEIARQLRACVESHREKFRMLDTATVAHRPATDRWTIQEVVGHLVDSACNNHQRFIRAQFSESLSFPKYEQNQWVRGGHYQEMKWESVVTLWYHYNLLLANVIENLPNESLSVPCTIEPYETCTLENLLVEYVEHLMMHLEKISQRIEGR